MTLRQSLYIGMKEADAVADLKGKKIRFRIIQRDGVGVTHTMEYIAGRHNLIITDGIVTKDTEG